MSKRKINLNSIIMVNGQMANEFQHESFMGALRTVVAGAGRFYNGTHKNNQITISIGDEILVAPVVEK